MSVFADRKNGKLTGRFVAKVKRNGHMSKGRFDTLKKAQDAEKEWHELYDKGAVPIIAKAAKTVDADAPKTLEQLIEAARGSLWRGDKSERTSFGRLTLAVRRIGFSVLIDSVDTLDIDKLEKGLVKDGFKDKTINRYMSAVSSALEWAQKRKYRTKPLPVLAWKKEGKGRIRWLSDEEEAALYRLTSPEVAKVIRVAIKTGMRRTELLSLEPRDVELKWVRLWETKTSTPRSIPISQLTYRDLHWLMKKDRMPGWRGLRYQWDKARRAMGLDDDPDFVFHCCRHTCATRFVMREKNLAKVQRWMGHKTILTTEKYAHVNDAMLVDMLEEEDEMTLVETNSSPIEWSPQTNKVDQKPASSRQTKKKAA